MTRTPTRRRPLLAAALVAGALSLAPGVQANVNIPEGGAVSPGSTQIINILVTAGCEGGLPMDAIEVVLPDAVSSPVPEWIAGWDAEIIPAAESDEQRTTVRWSGGPLEDGELLEFGLRLGFPDEPDAELVFPVTQVCGLVETSWVGTDGPNAAPTVVLQPRLGARDLLELRGTVRDIGSRIDELESRLGGVDPENLRSRVSDNESAVQSISERLDDLEARIEELESSSGG